MLKSSVLVQHLLVKNQQSGLCFTHTAVQSLVSVSGAGWTPVMQVFIQEAGCAGMVRSVLVLPDYGVRTRQYVLECMQGEVRK